MVLGNKDTIRIDLNIAVTSVRSKNFIRINAGGFSSDSGIKIFIRLVLNFSWRSISQFQGLEK